MIKNVLCIEIASFKKKKKIKTITIQNVWTFFFYLKPPLIVIITIVFHFHFVH